MSILAIWCESHHKWHWEKDQEIKLLMLLTTSIPVFGFHQAMSMDGPAPVIQTVEAVIVAGVGEDGMVVPVIAGVEVGIVVCSEWETMDGMRRMMKVTGKGAKGRDRQN